MPETYFCTNLRRKQNVQNHPTLNGIDYLEVLDHDAPLGSPRQRTLLVYFLKPLPASITANHLSIEGGVRIFPIKVLFAIRADLSPDLLAGNLINNDENLLFTGLDTPERVLVIRTDVTGDFSEYCLSLITSPINSSPPDGFDAVLSKIDFSFKIECPSDFDCRETQDCPPETLEIPDLDHLAKDYASFKQLILDRMSVIMPDWKERNPADLEITLVELLAYFGDHLSYYQDAVTTESYLETARQRPSLRRHARLLDYEISEGCNARVWVTLNVNAGGDGLVLPKSDPLNGRPTRFISKVSEPTRIDPDDFEDIFLKHQPVVFEAMHDKALYISHNNIHFYTWGDESCCLPKGATKATLRDNPEQRLRLKVGDVLIVEQKRDPETGEEEDANIDLRHAIRLTKVTPEALDEANGTRSVPDAIFDELFDQPIVEIEWSEEDALPFPLCLSNTIEDKLELLSTVHGNIILADHGLTLDGEAIPEASSLKTHFPVLKQGPVTFCNTHSFTDNKLSAKALFNQDCHKALPAVTLFSDTETWSPVKDLLNSDRFSPEFVAEMGHENRAHLRFGDGIFGKTPQRSLRARYRVGNGTAGNIGATAIAHVVTSSNGIVRVSNPTPAGGGIEPESFEEIRQYAPQAFRSQERAVTEEDYATMAERHPDVQKAVSLRRYTGSWYTQFITVDRKGGREITSHFKNEILKHLEQFRLAGHDLEISGPKFVSLDIVLTVCVEENHFKSDIKSALFETFSNEVFQDGRIGFFHPDRFTFGQPVYLSDVVSTAMSVPGIRWVDVDDKNKKQNRFRRYGEKAQGEIEAGLIRMDKVEIARLDNDPSLPENGKIDFIMVGGL